MSRVIVKSGAWISPTAVSGMQASPPPNASLPQQGRWTVRREVDRFVVFFFCFNTKRDTLLTEFLPTEQGEIDAKIFALVALDNLWIYSQEVIV
jgi:hypothetical protein